MAQPKTIEVSVLDWKSYNPRNDVKKSSWFRFDHSIITDPRFHDFSHSEFWFFVYILSHCSQISQGTVTIFVEHAVNSSKFELTTISSALTKLKKLGILEFSRNARVTNKKRTRVASVPLRTEVRNERDDTNDNPVTFPAGFEKIYQKYPRKVGWATALVEFENQITSPEDEALLLKAVENYRAFLTKEQKEPEFILNFDSFMKPPKGGKIPKWREWAMYEPGENEDFARGNGTFDRAAFRKEVGAA